MIQYSGINLHMFFYSHWNDSILYHNKKDGCLHGVKPGTANRPQLYKSGSSIGFDGLDGTGRIIFQFCEFNTALVGDTSRQGTVMVEQIPFTLELDN